MLNRSEIWLGDVVFDTETRDLRDSDGGRIELRNKSSEVLTFLANHPNEIVSKSDIMEAVWPDVTVSDESLTQCIADIRRAIGDKDQTLLKTFVSKGYGLTVNAAAKKQRAKSPLVFAVVFVLVLAGVALWWITQPDPPLAETPRIAILAFDDLSAGEDNGWLSDGIAEGVITELARYKEFLVIARNSSFSFRDTPTDITDIATQLNADYVLEGSKQKSGDRLRVTVQLINGNDGTHIWADEYDADIGELFDIQSQIVRSISSQIGRELIWNAPKIGGREKVSALHYYLQGNEAYFEANSESYSRAIRLYQKSIEADPEAPFGYAGMATVIWSDLLQGWIYPDVPYEELLQRGIDYAEKALAADPTFYASHIARGDLYFSAGDHEAAVNSYKIAAELNPSSSIAFAVANDPLIYLNRAEEAIELMERAIEINPIVPGWYYNNLSRAFWAVGRCAEGVQTIKKRPKFREWDYRALIVNLVCTGEIEEAEKAGVKLLELNTKFTISGHGKRIQRAINNPEYLERWLNHLRAAKLPEG